MMNAILQDQNHVDLDGMATRQAVDDPILLGVNIKLPALRNATSEFGIP
jgi:hypothetical protein